MSDDLCKRREQAERTSEEHECACEEATEMTLEAMNRYQPDETGCCLNCRRSREAHLEEGRCPLEQKTRRRFVTRGGEMVEVNAGPVRETRG